MFCHLLKKELKKIFKSITFYVFILSIVLFYFSQCPPPNTDSFKLPNPSELNYSVYPGPYGVKRITDPEKEISVMYMNLYRTYSEGTIVKGMWIFDIEVKLNDMEKQYIKDAMEKIAPDEYLTTEDNKLIKVSYDEYEKILNELDKKLGGSTAFSSKLKGSWIIEPKTYEDAAAELRDIFQNDKLTNAAARESADYLGITAGFFPIFLSAFILKKDEYSKIISAYDSVVSKYLALCIALLVPYVLISTYLTFMYYIIAKINSYNIDLLAFYKYTLWWISPTIFFTAALGMLASLIFNNGIAAVILQFILWLCSLKPLIGNYALNRFIIRFNIFGSHSDYVKWSSSIMINRIFYTLISFILILLTGYIYSMKKFRQELVESSKGES